MGDGASSGSAVAGLSPGPAGEVGMPSAVAEVLASPGSSLDGKTRATMEQGFSHGFADVRVHTGTRAGAALHALDAEAFASGRSIVIAPQLVGTRRQHVLAHELAHVVQQSRNGQGSARVVADASREHDAERAAGAVMHGVPATVQERAPSASIQPFSSKEHRSLGDTATGGALVNVGGDTPATTFMLTHGDVIALSGDYFFVDALRPPGMLGPDLMQLGTIPGSKGSKVGTRDEIIYALKDIDGADPRFAKGGIWEGFSFPEPVVNAVKARYNSLAAQNTSHFYAPGGRDASGQPIRASASEPSAFLGYRTLHERALTMAYAAGATKGGDISHAMAMEAAAQHFLTDSFSAGHLRTPIAKIRSYWGTRYPLFWYNLLHKMALDTAVRMNEIDTNATTIYASVQEIYEAIIAQVNTIAGVLPPITLGDLLALLFHDYDNVKGLAVSGGRVFGDSKLDQADPQNITRTIAQDAIRAGNHDISEAFALGSGTPGLSDAEVFRDVRATTHAPADRYMAETRIPDVDASNPVQNWQAADFETLWSKPMLGANGPTVGDQITKAMLPRNEIRDQLDGLANSFDIVDRRWSGNLHPRQAYREGFVEPLARNPRAGLLSIIHWAPNYGLREVDQDDISLATGNELKAKRQLHGMTKLARAAYVRELIDGKVFSDEEALVVDIFSSAPASERPEIYRLVEGHAWNGNFVEGVTVSDDDLWNALNSANLKRLRTLINAGVPAASKSKP